MRRLTLLLSLTSMLLMPSGAAAVELEGQPTLTVEIRPSEDHPGYLMVWFESCWDQQHVTHIVNFPDAHSLVDKSAGWANRPSDDPDCVWHNRGGIAMGTEGRFDTSTKCYIAMAYIFRDHDGRQVAVATATDTYCPSAE